MVAGYKEIRGKLGFFGKVWRVLFWGWQVLMVFWLFKYASDVTPLIKANTSPAGHVSIGTGIGLTMAVGMIAFFWVAGSIILGTVRTVYEENQDARPPRRRYASPLKKLRFDENDEANLRGSSSRMLSSLLQDRISQKRIDALCARILHEQSLRKLRYLSLTVDVVMPSRLGAVTMARPLSLLGLTKGLFCGPAPDTLSPLQRRCPTCGRPL